MFKTDPECYIINPGESLFAVLTFNVGVGWQLWVNRNSYYTDKIQRYEIEKAQAWAERIIETKHTTNSLVEQYGESYRTLIESAVDFLIEHEASWGLANPINVDEYIYGIIEAAER